MLHLFCGKIASGKSTLAREIAAQENGILLVQDEWMATLFPGEIKTIEDFASALGKLRKVMGPHIVALLRRGQTVVLDFHANTLNARTWMKSIITDAGVRHTLHYLKTSDETCKSRLHVRNASGEHEYQVSAEEFDLFAQHFAESDPAEGFHIIVHQPSRA